MSWKNKIIIPTLSVMSPLKLQLMKGQKRLWILAYHRIMDIQESFPYDKEVVSASPHDFEEQVRFLKKYFSILSFKQLEEHLKSSQNLPLNSLIITFDDGFRDNFTYAYPILKKYGIPATIFLTVENIESGQLYWCDTVAYYLKVLNKKAEEVRDFLRNLKTIPNEERKRLIHELVKQTGETPRVPERQSLTWEEIKEMSEHGMEFGSHTMTHPVLSQLSRPEDLDYEIVESKKRIEEKIWKPVIVFSYPVGGANAFNEIVQEKIQQAGYSFAVSYVHGINSWKNSLMPFTLKRFVCDHEKLMRFKVKLAFPSFFKR